ncbi:MAG: ABC transporter ATP-binding protein [Burkholderiaceae bacterium]|jgi:branched-chain amino acid transport system ATP-binding protein
MPTPNPDLLIRASGLNTYYGASHILRGVDFSVARAETIGLMGRNGMGKSTLLKSLMGLVKPRSGSVEIMGRNMTGRPPYEVAQLGVAYVPEGRGIFGNLSVVENLKMAARAGTRGQRDWTYERVLETFPRLTERLGHGGQQLSGGEQQMLTIGRALMTNPDLLILDEATEGLAPLIAREIWRICGLIRDSGISSIIVDKNWKHVTQITDRNVILVKGEVVFEGTSDALLAQPELLTQHLGV